MFAPLNDGITLEAFKQTVAEFCKEVETLGDRDLEAGMQAVTKAYLGINFQYPSERAISVSYYEHASRQYGKRRMSLDFGDPLGDLKRTLGID